jgi:DNA-binding CsgD family transcriptional regulator
VPQAGHGDPQEVDSVLGPLQMMAVDLPPDGGARARVLAEVDQLRGGGRVRVLDMALMTRGPDGDIVLSAFGADAAGGDEDFGELLSRLLPQRGAPVDGDAGWGQLWAHAQARPVGATVAVLLVEHRWARGLFDAIDEVGGVVLGTGQLTSQLSAVIDTEVAVMEDAARSVAAAQAAEADARLRVAAAGGEAPAAVSESVRIRSAAAVEALRALTDAGLVELAAAHEAADALSAAGLIIATADEAADRAVEAAASIVEAADEASAEAIAQDRAAVAAADAKKADAARAASITPAEIRVLRYLPTTLTFALIADKLGISRGAAKSRAERAYRKLDVHNRADAVHRTRALRVIP